LLGRPEVSLAEAAAATAWVAGWAGAAATPAAHDQLVEESVHVVRGDLLAALGRNEGALAEYRAAVAAFQTRPLALLALARRLHAGGWHWPAIQAATQVWERAPVASPADLPRGVLTLLYPAPYWDTVEAASQRHGVDPLLLFALIRQESRFTPWVGSGAGALGLAQIMPATGLEIARGLGRSGHASRDLYRPQVSIEFGAYYLGRQVRGLGGRVPLALAAYNGGAGNALRWAGRDLAIDQDLFLESIDFEETALYVRIVLEDYWTYRLLYGGERR
jgi:soluble lytic murein transglycosylase